MDDRHNDACASRSSIFHPPSSSLLAITHTPSPHLAECQLTFVSRAAIDFDRALRQHVEYCRVLRDCGVEIRTLTVNAELPDGVFIEDTFVVLDEVAVECRLGTHARREE